MIGFLAFVLAASAPPPPVPSPEQQPFYLVDFTVTLDGDTIVEGSKEVRTGVYSTETRTRIFPPACDKGAVEFGYRKITLYVRENGHPEERAGLYFNIKERREVDDHDNDPCEGQRPEDVNHSFHGHIDLERGEEKVVDIGHGALLHIKRR